MIFLYPKELAHCARRDAFWRRNSAFGRRASGGWWTGGGDIRTLGCAPDDVIPFKLSENSAIPWHGFVLALQVYANLAAVL